MIPIWFCNIRLQKKKKKKMELKKNAIRRDHIWKQVLRYNTTSLKFLFLPIKESILLKDVVD